MRMRMSLQGIRNHWFRTLNIRRWVIYAALLFSILTILRQTQRDSLYPLPTVNVVLALTKAQDYSWTSKLTIPSVKIIHFIADDPTAQFHPPANKGREALMYLTYVHQFYDFLPDVSIFVHGDDTTWHIDPIFDKSTANAINLLDLDEVLRRGYLNLRTSWKNACPDWINTTNSYKGSTSNIFFTKNLHDNETLGEKFEEPYMKAAFEENFPGRQAPEILAQPCCSQFSVSRDAIRSIPRARYQEKIDWLLKTPLSDQLTGRMWEHMWQFLFLGKAADCVVEFKALCSGWRICFEDQDELDHWNQLVDQLEGIKPMPPSAAVSKAMRLLEVKLDTLKAEAVRRGSRKYGSVTVVDFT